MQIIKQRYTEWIVLIILIAFFLKSVFIANLSPVNYVKLTGLISLLIFIPIFLNLRNRSFKNNNVEKIILILIALYFVLRLFALFYYDIDKSLLITAYFEFFCLVLINNNSLKDIYDLKWVFEVFSIIILVINILCTILFMLYKFQFIESGSGFDMAVRTYTWYETYVHTSLYKNPNSAGLFTAVSVLMMFKCIEKKNILFYIYFIYSLNFIRITECRNAQLALLLILLIALMIRLPQINIKICTVAVLIGCILATSGIVVIAFSNDIDVIEPLKSTERKIDSYSSFRYTIWKYNIGLNRDSFVIGKGNLALEKKAREEHLNYLMQENKISESTAQYLVQMGAHNGYLGMWFSCGLICAIVYFIIVLLKLINLDSNYMRAWWPMIVYIFIINLLENMFLITGNYTFSVLLMILLTKQTSKNCEIKSVN